MLIDANLLIYAAVSSSPFHRAASPWLTDQLNGNRPVGLPWASLVAFVRITTNPRAYEQPMDASAAWTFVEEWLASPAAWTPVPTHRHAELLGDLVRRYAVSGNLITDAHLAALALEHGLTLYSADSDFARFSELDWHNPLN
jgi:toxin-antitoxin system PIN domain toxin